MTAMKPEAALTAAGSRLRLRRARFEDVPGMLRLMQNAVEEDCRGHYGSEQRRAIFLSYLQTMFVDIVRPFDTILAEADGRVLGFAQLDATIGRVRALFVAAETQRRGLGRLLLGGLERLAEARGRRRLHGAMSLNAVPFYERAGFRPCPGPGQLLMSGVAVPILPMEKALAPGRPPRAGG
jgi:GNAT superfamily N-acetyltransferase